MGHDGMVEGTTKFVKRSRANSRQAHVDAGEMKGDSDQGQVDVSIHVE
jgi:hypothetical protein